MVDQPRIPLDRDFVAQFCQKWKITEFALFGSVLRDDFRSDSDVDVLVTFAPEVPWTLFDLVDMRDELTRRFGREVDVVSSRALKNPFRRKRILETRRVIHAG